MSDKRILWLELEGECVSVRRYVYQVTVNSIRAIKSEGSMHSFDRKTGKERKTTDTSVGLKHNSIGREDLRRLEEWLKKNGKLKNGVYVWKSSFKLCKDCHGKPVYTGYSDIRESFNTHHWLRTNGFEVVDISRT